MCHVKIIIMVCQQVIETQSPAFNGRRDDSYTTGKPSVTVDETAMY